MRHGCARGAIAPIDPAAAGGSQQRPSAGLRAVGGARPSSTSSRPNDRAARFGRPNGPAVAWFAISNNGSTFTANTDGTYPNWSATVLNAAQWNSGTVIFGPNSGVNFNTSSVGTYSSLFDSDALVTVFYQNSFAGPGPIAAGTTTGFHFFYPSLAGSDFVAGTANGLVLDKSRQASVATPEPASLAIWGLGALGCAIAGYRRRKGNA